MSKYVTVLLLTCGAHGDEVAPIVAELSALPGYIGHACMKRQGWRTGCNDPLYLSVAYTLESHQAGERVLFLGGRKSAHFEVRAIVPFHADDYGYAMVAHVKAALAARQMEA
jgi:hypothetical protein